MPTTTLYTCRVVKRGSLVPTGRVLTYLAKDLQDVMRHLDADLAPDELARVTGRSPKLPRVSS